MPGRTWYSQRGGWQNPNTSNLTDAISVSSNGRRRSVVRGWVVVAGSMLEDAGGRAPAHAAAVWTAPGHAAAAWSAPDVLGILGVP
jgi:hypothetical protein